MLRQIAHAGTGSVLLFRYIHLMRASCDAARFCHRLEGLTVYNVRDFRCCLCLHLVLLQDEENAGFWQPFWVRGGSCPFLSVSVFGPFFGSPILLCPIAFLHGLIVPRAPVA